MNEIVPDQVRILAADDEPFILDLYNDVLYPEEDQDQLSLEMDALKGRLFGTAPALNEPNMRFEVVSCRQGNEAVAAVKDSLRELRPFSVAFLDVNMPPGPDGILTAERIRKLDSHIEIVIVTGYSDINPVQIARRIPPVHKLLYIQKPFHPQEIFQFASSLSSKWLNERRIFEIQENLEQKVSQRTSELAELNEKLNKDIEERCLVEAQLQEMNQTLASLIQASPIPIIAMDMDGKIMIWNQAAEKTFGWTEEDVLGRENPIIPKANQKEFRQLHEKALRGEQLPYTELIRKKKDGSMIEVSLSRSLIRDADGNLTGIFALVSDITERKKTEKILRNLAEELEERVTQRTWQLKEANQSLKVAMENARHLASKAEAASIAKGEFLANMSHEIRTPMNGIIGACELAIDTSPEEGQEEYLNIVLMSAKSLLGLINDILDFSKIEAGRLHFDYIPFSLTEIVDDIYDIFFEKISEKNLDFIVDIDPNVPQKIIGDPLRLRQVLINLIANAFKFTQQGEIRVSIKNLPENFDIKDCDLEKLEYFNPEKLEFEKLNQTKPDKIELLFSVKDTGIGIHPDICAKLFDAFIQADGSTTRKYGGTGLGLAICKRIVNMMDGSIWIESDHKKGAAFFFTASFSQVSEEDNHILQDIKVMLADSNSSSRSILMRFLVSFGCRTFCVKTGYEAVSIYDNALKDQENFDLLIIDYDLLDNGGIQVLKKIKAYSIETPPILMIGSQNHGSDEFNRTEEIGVERFLKKPVRQSILLDAMLKIFGQESTKLKKVEKDSDFHEIFSDVHVLLVEDNSTNQRVATAILNRAGINNVENRVNGQEAVEAVKNEKFDIVLMDIQMPVLDGLEATRIIRKKLGIKDLPIIAMTAHVMSGDKDRCIEAGMNGYVAKPINRQELFTAILNNLPQKPYNIEISQIPTDEPVSGDNVSGDNVSDRLCAIEFSGFDIQAGIKRIGGEGDLFLKIVKGFYDENKNFSFSFKDLIEKEKYDDARIMAHSIKGAAGNISAKDLENAARVLENACVKKDQEVMAVNLEKTEEALLTIKSFLEANEAEESDTAENFSDILDQTSLVDLLDSLEASLLEMAPVEAEACFTEIKALISASQEPQDKDQAERFDNLGDFIGQFDFDEALKILKQIKEFEKC
ncbi:response regulator [Desulfobacterales bacterium HSG16]|nr:response regulator [Desulfobacterales bacterium HSG16]